MEASTATPSSWDIAKRVYCLFTTSFFQVIPYLILGLVVSVFIGMIVSAILFGIIGISDVRALNQLTASQHYTTLFFAFLGAILANLPIIFFNNAIIQKVWAIIHKRSPLQKHFWRVAADKTFPVLFAYILLEIILLGTNFIAGWLTSIIGVTFIDFLIVLAAVLLNIFFVLKLLFWPVAILLEEKKVMNAMWRSWQLSGDNLWKMIGVFFFAILIPTIILGSLAVSTAMLALPFFTILIALGSVLAMPTLGFTALCILFQTLSKDTLQPEDTTE